MTRQTLPRRQPRRPAIPEAVANRVPPGQIVATRWPVLHQGDVPRFNPAQWKFRVWGLVDAPRTWRWPELAELPTVEVSGDLHCVTRWSSLDHRWSGVRPVAFAAIVGVGHAARFAMLHGEGGYTANVPLEVLFADDVVLATHHNGEVLSAAHGGPLRAVIPSRYAWKSVKWLRGIEFLAEDRSGFWESYGYSNSADPWREERFASDL